ncbi:Uncharacterized protein QJS10_CPB15g00150 [Acorus calamus]|uniref:Glycosyltransferase n=1 Tax=Acorus calamus TaxID=4465 RepID=A0AAV9D3V4_ACOCL|nr:Uncharacterized protein QJS10_CPB15g00150 [Acorus calamus]
MYWWEMLGVHMKNRMTTITTEAPLMSPSLGRVLKILAIVAAFGFLFAFVHYRSAYLMVPGFLSSSSPTLQDPTVTQIAYSDSAESEAKKMERVLKAAAMKDKTVILTPLNAAWAGEGSMIDLLMESFAMGNGTQKLLKHLVMVALDKKAYARCLSLHPHCISLKTEGVDYEGEQRFMTPGYLKVVWRKIDFLHSVLQLGYSFIFTDADIVWFRDPFPYFHPDGDFQIACDQFNGNSTDLHNWVNTGFKSVKSNKRTIEFYKFWYLQRERHPGRHDQDVFNLIKHDTYVEKIGIQFKFLNTAHFGGFCQPSRDFNKVCTMHANCCAGLQKKLRDLRLILDDWKNYMAQPSSVKKSHPPSWSAPKNCRM